MNAHRSRWLGRRYLCEVGGHRVPSFAAMLYLGSVAGIAAGAIAAQAGGMSAQRFAAAAMVLLIPALVGARLWFVLQNAASFRLRGQRIFRPLDAGAAQDGGLVLCVIASIPILELLDLPFRMFWDNATLTLLVGAAVTRVGCLMNGCCAGRPTEGLLAALLPNHRGEWRHRYPTPLLEAILALALLAGALFARSTQPPNGIIFASALMLHAVGRALIALTRETGDRRRMLRISFGMNSLFVLAAVAMLWRAVPASSL